MFSFYSYNFANSINIRLKTNNCLLANLECMTSGFCFSFLKFVTTVIF